MKHRKPPPSLSELAPVNERKVTVGSKSIEAILAELAPAAKIEAPPPDSWTVAQAAKAWGIGYKATQNRISRLVMDGRVEKLGQYRERGSDGNAAYYYRAVSVSKS